MIKKPPEFVALWGLTEPIFEVLRAEFNVPREFGPFNLSTIDSVTLSEMADPRQIAGFGMRRLQQLRIITTEGNVTNTDTAMTLLAELMRLLMNLGPRCKREDSAIVLQNGLKAFHAAHRAIGNPDGNMGAPDLDILG